MKRLFFDRFFVDCQLILVFVLASLVVFLCFGIPALLSAQLGLLEFVFLLAVLIFSLLAALANFVLMFRCAAVGPSRVVYLEAFRALRTDPSALRFAYLSASKTYLDGYTKDSSWERGCPVSDPLFLSFSKGRIGDYEYRGRLSFEWGHRREILLTVGLSSSAASLMLSEFKGTIVVPSAVYRSNQVYFDSICKDSGISLEIVP